MIKQLPKKNVDGSYENQICTSITEFSYWDWQMAVRTGSIPTKISMTALPL